MKFCSTLLVALLGCFVLMNARAVEIPQEKWDQVMRDIEELKASKSAPSPIADMKAVDTAMDAKFGPNANVTIKTGKLQIALLTQIWYYNIQKDNRGFFSDANGNGIVDNNLSNDINSFRIRRTELRLTMDFNECLTASVMFDPAREAAGFPTFPSNQGFVKKSPVGNGQATAGTSTTLTGGLAAGLNGTAGAGSPPRLLREAFINYHNIVPHHDFQIGQYKPFVGEEGTHSSGELDFCERSMLGFFADQRDLGASVHGSWWGKDANDRDGRIQYWGGVFDGASTYYNPGVAENRSDNNQSKDFNFRAMVRPLWSDCAGKLELGVSYMGGTHGISASDGTLFAAVTATTPIPQQTWASKGNVWFSYRCGEMFAKGLWVKGEWGYIRDRQEGSLVAFGNGNLGTGAAAGLSQTALEPFSSQGGYGSIGYRFGEASWVKCMPCWLKDFEVLARYDQFQNIQTANLGNPIRTSVFNTQCKTIGLNYYFSGHTKIQANYNFVNLPIEKSNGTRNFHDVKNDSFVMNFQVTF